MNALPIYEPRFTPVAPERFSRTVRFGILSTDTSPMCGPAKFSASLSGALSAHGSEAGVIRVADGQPSPSNELIGEPVNGPASSVAACKDLLNEVDVAVIQHVARPLRRRSGRHRRRVACPVDRHRRYDPQRPYVTPTFGARGDRRDGGPSSRHVRGSATTPVSDLRRRPPQGHHDPARCDRPQRASCEAPEQTHHLDVGHVAPWKGHREGHRRDAFAGRCGGSASIPRRRSDGPQGLGRRRRGIPRGPNRTGAAQRRGGFGEIRPRLLRRPNVVRAHPAILRRRAAVRLHGAGDVRRTRRSDSERQARRGDRISACCRAAQRRSGHRRRPRRPGRAGLGAAPDRHAAPPCRLHGGRGASTGTGDGVVGRGQAIIWGLHIASSRNGGDGRDRHDAAPKLRPSAGADRPPRHLRARPPWRAVTRRRLSHRRRRAGARRRHSRTRRPTRR